MNTFSITYGGKEKSGWISLMEYPIWYNWLDRFYGGPNWFVYIPFPKIPFIKIKDGDESYSTNEWYGDLQCFWMEIWMNRWQRLLKKMHQNEILVEIGYEKSQELLIKLGWN